MFLTIYLGMSLVTAVGVWVAQRISRRNCQDRHLRKLTTTNADEIQERAEFVTENWLNEHHRPVVLIGILWFLWLPIKILTMTVDHFTGRNPFQCSGLLKGEAAKQAVEIAVEVEAKREEVQTQKRSKKEEQQLLRESV